MFSNKQKANGFTIIELTIAMSMLSVLLIIILMSILNITSTYNKGITLKRVNQSGRSIATELQANLRKSTPISSDATGSSNIGTYKSLLGPGPDTVLTRLCTGHDSFVWNVYSDVVGVKTSEKYSSGEEVVGMIKISDTGGTLCKTLPGPEKSNSKNLLDDGLVMRQPVEIDEGGAGGRLIKFTFTISTPDGDGIISGGGCQGGKEGEFCALNTFVVTSYAKGI